MRPTGGHYLRTELFQLAQREGITLASEGPRVFGPVVDVALLDRVRLTGINLRERGERLFGRRVGRAAPHQHATWRGDFVGGFVQVYQTYGAPLQ